MSLEQTISEIHSTALAQLDRADALDSIEAVRVEFLGRKGKLSEISKEMGEISKKARHIYLGLVCVRVREVCCVTYDRLKALIDAHSDRILGFTAFGVGAGETMATVELAVSAGLPYTALRDLILTHPTMAEGLNALFSLPFKAA